MASEHFPVILLGLNQAHILISHHENSGYLNSSKLFLSIKDALYFLCVYCIAKLYY